MNIRTNRDRPASTAPARRRAEKPSDRPRPVVLLLDDDEDSRTIYHDMLDFAGYRVMAVSDGIEGLRAAEAQAPDVVVTDVHMPRMNGIELARVLRGESAMSPTIIAVTADSLVDQVEVAEPLFDEVLVKPVSPGDLVRAVRAYVPPAQGAAD